MTPPSMPVEHGPLAAERASWPDDIYTTIKAANLQQVAFVPDAGHVYSTALYCSGLDPLALKAAGKGRNASAPLAFKKKP